MRSLYIAIFVISVLAVGYWHGQTTGRWKALPPLSDYVSRLEQVPVEINDWSGTEMDLDDPESLQRAGIEGYLSRKYVHRDTQQAVTILIVCGRPGPISVHTPDVCYRGAGYVPITSPERVAMSRNRQSESQIWTMRFTPPKSRIDIRELKISWYWYTSNGVETPLSARMAFANEPALYKVYFIEEIYPGLQSAEVSTRQSTPGSRFSSFLDLFTGVLNQSLVKSGL